MGRTEKEIKSNIDVKTSNSELASCIRHYAFIVVCQLFLSDPFQVSVGWGGWLVG